MRFLPSLLVAFFLFSSNILLHAQILEPGQVQCKLVQGKLEASDFYTENGDTIYKKYTRRFACREGKDSVLYVEHFDVNKNWYINRYVVNDTGAFPDGWQQQFDIKGSLIFEQFYSSRKKDPGRIRKYSYYPSGQMMTMLNYKKNKLNGSAYFFHNNGMLKQHLEYRDGRLYNIVAYYDQDGRILDAGTFCNGEGIVNVYSANGKLIKMHTYTNGKAKHQATISE